MNKIRTITKKIPKPIQRVLIILLVIAALGILCVAGLNLWVIGKSHNHILGFSELQQESLDTEHDCIIILGAGLRDGEPSPMLRDRLETGISLYKKGNAPKILMSGDHGRTGYNEVQVMKQYALDAGVPSSDIFMDHAGFSTYESMIRARDIFEVKSPIIVTQKYHLYRAAYIASELDLNCLGVATEDFKYGGQFHRTLRECLARCKDVFTVLFDIPPTYDGEKIPVSGNGDLTND